METLWNAFMMAVFPHFAYFAVVLTALVGTIVFIKYVPADLRYAKIALELVRTLLGHRLNEKTDLVLSIWADALGSVDTSATEDEKAQQFTNYIEAKLNEQKISLSPIEIKVIEEAAQLTLQLLKTKKTTTKKAVQALSADATVAVLSVRKG